MKSPTKEPKSYEQLVCLEGERAYERGLLLSNNPHKVGTNDYTLWMLGWLNKNFDKKKENEKK